MSLSSLLRSLGIWLIGMSDRLSLSAESKPDEVQSVKSMPLESFAHMPQLGLALQSCIEGQQLVAAQLRSVMEKNEEAASVFIKNTQSTQAAVETLVSYVNQTMTESQRWVEELQSSAACSEKNSQEMSAFLSENVDQLTHNTQVAKMMMGEFKRLPGLLKELDDSAYMIKLISLNASIEAAHCGDLGLAFGVISHNISLVSEEVRSLIDRVQEALAKLSQTLQTEVIEQAAEEKLNVETNKIELIQEKNQENNQVFNQTYEQLQQFRESILTRVEKGAREITEMTLGILSTVQYQDIVRQQLEQVVKAISLLQENATPLLSAAKNHSPLDHWKKLDLDALFNDYVMQSQRDIHGGVFRSSQDAGVSEGVSQQKEESGTAALKIELF